jgi:hypothetical protein
VHRGPDDPETLASMHHLADSYAQLGRHAEALTLFEQALALMKAEVHFETTVATKCHGDRADRGDCSSYL